MKRSDYMLAALASAVLPNLGVAGVRENVQASATDEAKGIDQTVIQDASGKLYDVYATDTKEGRTRLIRRVKAAQTLAAAREPGGSASIWTVWSRSPRETFPTRPDGHRTGRGAADSGGVHTADPAQARSHRRDDRDDCRPP